MRNCFNLVLVIMVLELHATSWHVGPNSIYKTPSAVSTLVQDGDSIWIEAGEYLKDVCLWKANNLFISGKGGYAQLNAERTAYGGKAIWVIAGNNTRIEFIKFSNCEVVDRNGAGIRLEGKNLFVSQCIFHHNQNGILTGNQPESDVVIEHSEFAHNGAGDGFSHNIYVNHVRSLTIRYSYFHHAYYGHEIKSRADKNIILYNRITNEDGDASYEIDVPNGGQTLVLGNVIQQSKFSDNNTIISYGREGLTNTGPHNFYFIHNTVVNNEDKGILFNIQSRTDTLLYVNNIIAGNLTVLSGIPNTVLQSNNIIRLKVSEAGFKDPDSYDYYLSDSSVAIDNAKELQGAMLGYELNADKEYVHPLGWKLRYRDAFPDVGAFEEKQVTRNEDHNAYKRSYVFNYDHTTQWLHIRTVLGDASEIKLMLCNLNGHIISQRKFQNEEIINLSIYPEGIYLIKIYLGGRVFVEKLFKSN
ncbi:MAG: right-handed parallel beta-helix repeat-containing protein [Saprospiraceae bacterium]|nr:right-handed parallel beta-helix repeat-containing protein [Saprospiraceae bacterium]